jgi:hypothetical protein
VQGAMSSGAAAVSPEMSLILQIVNNVHRTRIISQRASRAIPTSSNMTATGVAMKPCRKALSKARLTLSHTSVHQHIEMRRGYD